MPSSAIFTLPEDPRILKFLAFHLGRSGFFPHLVRELPDHTAPALAEVLQGAPAAGREHRDGA
jgi:hypothetical protein